MLRRVKQYIQSHSLLQPGDKVLVCVSGGADSVALLDVLLRSGYECVVAHCNFHLRGEESDRDQDFVAQLAAQMREREYVHSLPVEIQSFDTQSYAQAHHISIEMAARDLRYAWFEELADRYHCAAIAVAHHQNDQAETILLNLKRGTGIRGLQGMCPKNGRIIRPLLCTTHDYICHYLRDIRHIAWVEDSTNNDTHIQRNAIREQLKHYTKAEIEHFAETAEIIQGYVDWLEGKNSRGAQQAKEYEALRANR